MITFYYMSTTTNLKSRISDHIKLGTDKWYDGSKWNKQKEENPNGLLKRTTSCQLRSGLEHLLKKSRLNFREVLKDRIHFSGVKMVGKEHIANRFYAEDMAIGLGNPWINVDSER